MVLLKADVARVHHADMTATILGVGLVDFNTTAFDQFMKLAERGVPILECSRTINKSADRSARYASKKTFYVIWVIYVAAQFFSVRVHVSLCVIKHRVDDNSSVSSPFIWKNVIPVVCTCLGVTHNLVDKRAVFFHVEAHEAWLPSLVRRG